MKKEIEQFLIKYNIQSLIDLSNCVIKYGKELNPNIVYSVSELLNPNKVSNSAYFTDDIICKEIFYVLPKFEEKTHIRILEPSVGSGAFLPFIAEHFKEKDIVEIWINDIDSNELELANLIFDTFYRDKYPNVAINIFNEDYLKLEILNKKFDLIIGNPPYQKLNPKDIDTLFYKMKTGITKTTNIFIYFFEKTLRDGDIVSLIIPKSLLNAPEYIELRNHLQNYKIESIIDFGENGFKGVKIETINIIVNTLKKPENTFVKSISKKVELMQNQNYITDPNFPTWLIYRNQFFDTYASELELGIFSVYRDRQISSKNCHKNGNIRVLRSRNIATNSIYNIENYDLYLDNIQELSVSKFLNKKNIVCIPNLSYSPRACFLPNNCIVDGSVALLKTNKAINENDLKIFETQAFRHYYQIARNYGTRSLNIDSNSVYYFGIRRKK